MSYYIWYINIINKMNKYVKKLGWKPRGHLLDNSLDSLLVSVLLPSEHLPPSWVSRPSFQCQHKWQLFHVTSLNDPKPLLAVNSLSSACATRQWVPHESRSCEAIPMITQNMTCGMRQCTWGPLCRFLDVGVRAGPSALQACSSPHPWNDVKNRSYRIVSFPRVRGS